MLITIISLTFIYAVLFASNIFPAMRGPEEWRWAFAIPGYPIRQLVPAVAICLYGYLIIRAILPLLSTNGQPSRPERIRILLIAGLSVPLIQASLLFTESPDILRTLFYRTISAGASGSFTVGSYIASVEEYLRNYPLLMPTFPVHPQRYPPGIPLLFVFVRRIFEHIPSLATGIANHLRIYQCHDLALMALSPATLASASLQMILPIINGLIVIPLYTLSKRNFSVKTALVAVSIYPLVPSFALWAGRWDQIYPLLVCLVWLCFDIGLYDRKRGWLFVSGLLMAFTSFLSFGPLVMLMPIGLSALYHLWREERFRHIKANIVDALILFAGLSLPWLLYWLIYGVSIVEIWQVSMSYHLGLERNYATWLIHHLIDFFSFLGIPLAILFIVALSRSYRTPFREDQRALSLVAGVALGLLLLDLSGTAQGEVARVWLFWTPFAALVAVYGLMSLPDRRRILIAVVVLLGLQLLLFNATLRVVTTGIVDPPASQTATIPPGTELPLPFTFGDSITLFGYTLNEETVKPGDTVVLTLYWQGKRSIDKAYTVFVHLIAGNQVMLTQDDHMPVNGSYPTTCWLSGNVIEDTYVLDIPDDASPGDYSIYLGLYELSTGQRLVAKQENEQSVDRVRLVTIRVRK